MKAILEFTLPEENNEHLSAVNGGKYYSQLWELKEWLHRVSRKKESLAGLTPEAAKRISELFIDID